MAEVVIIPTGKLEHAGLSAALEQLFADHTFCPRPEEQPLNGFTSRDVARIPDAGPVPTELDELVAELIAAVAPGRKGAPADFAFVVEDVELANDHQPALVVEVFRHAVNRYVERYAWPTRRAQEQAVSRLRERCAFHLFRPMTEAYFFGEANALIRAEASSTVAVLPANLDLEAFQTTDANFLGLPPDNRPKHKRRIIDMPARQRHPKSYLHYLCDPTLNDPQRKYKETQGGVAALRRLDWEQVLAVSPHCPFLHAFLDDLCVALDHSLPFVQQARTHPLTRFKGTATGVLRNL